MTIAEVCNDLLKAFEVGHHLPAMLDQPCIVKIVDADGTVHTGTISKVVLDGHRVDRITNVTLLAQ